MVSKSLVSECLVSRSMVSESLVSESLVSKSMVSESLVSECWFSGSLLDSSLRAAFLTTCAIFRWVLKPTSTYFITSIALFLFTPCFSSSKRRHSTEEISLSWAEI